MTQPDDINSVGGDARPISLYDFQRADVTKLSNQVSALIANDMGKQVQGRRMRRSLEMNGSEKRSQARH